MRHARRIRHASELGRAHAPVDAALGALALVPLAAGALGALAAPKAAGPLSRICAAWSGGLLAFLGGVRRGLSFSEAGGARPGEYVGLLAPFFAGVGAALFRSPLLAAVGLMGVAASDSAAARRGEAPAYFSRYRPLQLGLGAMLLLGLSRRARRIRRARH